MEDFCHIIPKLLILFITSKSLCLTSRIATVEECSLIITYGRKECLNEYQNPIKSMMKCKKASCCWENGVCYHPIDCADGYYGWRCHLRCNCLNNSPCSRKEGICSKCSLGFWGIGCQLKDHCTYNDHKGLFYMGHKAVSKMNNICERWEKYISFSLKNFPGNVTSIQQLGNYCRNPSSMESAWCYSRNGDVQLCDLQACSCPIGHYNVSCRDECHCRKADEACVHGVCASGCHARWSGPQCSVCADGYFGEYCEHVCRCRDREVCHKTSGVCLSGCLSGWHGNNCIHECRDGMFGKDCSYRCNCNDDNEVCDKTIGHCATGCKQGYGGDGCLLKLPKLAKGITRYNRSANHITIYWEEWDNVAQSLGGNSIIGYKVVYKRRTDERWSTSDVIDKRNNSYRVGGLKKEEELTFKVAPVHVSGLPGLFSDALNIKTCGDPIGLVQNLNSRSRGRKAGRYTDISISWKSPQKSDINCDSIVKYKLYLHPTQNFLKPPTTKSTTVFTTTETTTYIPYSNYTEQYTMQNNANPELPTTTLSTTPSNDFPLFSTFRLQNNTKKTSIVLNRMNLFSNLYYAVTFVNNAGLESPPAIDKFIGKSNGVEKLKGEGVSNSVIMVSWQPPTLSNSRIIIYSLAHRLLNEMSCQRKKGSWQAPIYVEGTSYNLSNLETYSTYEIKVKAKTLVGMGMEQSIIATTLTDAPRVKLDIKEKMVKSKSALLKWSSVECREWRGPIRGYVYEIYSNASFSVEHETRQEKLVSDDDARSTIENDKASYSTTYENNLFKKDILNKSNASDEESLHLKGLTPFLNYTIVVWMENSDHNGPRSSIVITTTDDYPPAPGNLRVTSRSSENLYVQWDKPHPPQGIITKYKFSYIQMDDTTDPRVYTRDSSIMYFNITNTKPYRKFSMKVRAGSSKGYGPWSEVLHEYTDQALPSEPTHLRNISRGSKHVTLEWKPPKHLNGLLMFYSVTCDPVFSTTSDLANSTDDDVQALIVNFTNLRPGLNYECRVAAVNMAGKGPSSYLIFWTEPLITFHLPEPSLEQEDLNADDLLVVKLKPVPSMDYVEESDSLYRIVVERYGAKSTNVRLKRDVVESVDDENANKDDDADASYADMTTPFTRVIGERKQSIDLPDTPCNLSHSQLVDYSTAMKRRLNCYIAAEIPQISDELDFVIGDNKTHGGYHNAKLNPAWQYDVWYGIVVTVDGVTAFSYSKTKKIRYDLYVGDKKLEKIKLETAEEMPEEKFDSLSGMVIALIIVVITVVLAFLFILFMLRFTKRTKKTSSSPEHTEPQDISKALLSHPDELPEDVGRECKKAIPVSQLWDYVVPRKPFGDDLIRAEFRELKKNLVFKADEAMKKENKAKNRYFNIVAYDHSRVVLQTKSSDVHSTYINANYIAGYNKPKAYIAAQGPTKKTIEDTWRMVWQEQCCIIVMVTNFNEAGRNKCESYWPESGSCEYDEVTVQLVNTEEFADFKIRVFAVSKEGTKRTVHQFHFTTWPDHGVPVNPTSLLEFRKKIRSYMSTDDEQPPMLVHCSAGVGRTGTFITLDSMLEQARVDGEVNVLEFVKSMRNDRVNMVQTVDQYIFIYDALLEALHASTTSTLCSDFRSRYCQMTKTNAETGKLYMQEEFEMLEATKQLYKQDNDPLEALLPENLPKNRNIDIIPGNLRRPKISTLLDNRSSYINAVFVDGYKQGDAFIVTQTPLASTVSDFWAMVIDNQCSAIISLCDQEESIENSYCPARSFHSDDLTDKSFTIGPFTASLVSSSSCHDFVQQEFILSCDPKVCKKHREQLVKRFVMKKSDGLPARDGLLSLFRALEKWQQKTRNHTVVVHCRDGATYSGLFCAAWYLVERLKTEHEIDVFLGVRHVRVNRPQFIPDVAQYRYLHDLLIDFLDCFDTYANFEASL